MLVEEKVPETLGVDARFAPPPRRRAYWPIALLMLGLVLAGLGAALLLDQRYRSPVGTEPSAVAALQTQAAAVPTAVSPPASATTASTTSTAVPAVAAKPTPATADTAVPAAVPTAAAVTSPLPENAADLLTPLQKEIVEAYFRYWDVRGRAYYSLETGELKDVMAGDELAREEEGVRELAAQGRAARLDIEHNFRIVSATAGEATVYDEYVNHSVFLDSTTKQEIPTKEPPALRNVSFEMKKVDGIWKVVDGAYHG